MASTPRANLLYAPSLASCQGARGCLPAGNLRGGLTPKHLPTAEFLPTPHLQIRIFSGWTVPARPPGVGLLANPSSVPTAAAGPLSTSNYLRLSFAAPLPAIVRAAQPEIWLFTHRNRRPPAARGGLLHQAGWDHSGPRGAATEFCGAAVQQSLALPRPFADIVLDANRWVAPHGQPEQMRHFRFALVVNAPAGQATPAGNHLGPLSAEVWLGASPQQRYTYAFHRPTRNYFYH